MVTTEQRTDQSPERLGLAERLSDKPICTSAMGLISATAACQLTGIFALSIIVCGPRETVVYQMPRLRARAGSLNASRVLD